MTPLIFGSFFQKKKDVEAPAISIEEAPLEKKPMKTSKKKSSDELLVVVVCSSKFFWLGKSGGFTIKPL